MICGCVLYFNMWPCTCHGDDYEGTSAYFMDLYLVIRAMTTIPTMMAAIETESAMARMMARPMPEDEDGESATTEYASETMPGRLSVSPLPLS